MKVVFVVSAIHSGAYEYDSWICSIFENEENAYDYLKECEVEDVGGEYIYMVDRWQVK